MPVALDAVTVLTAVLPANVNITPNDSGLPGIAGIAALRTIVGASFVPCE